MFKLSMVCGVVLSVACAFVAPRTLEAQTPETAGFVADGATITGGALGSNILVSSALNAIVSDQIANGTLRTLMEIRDLQDPTGQNDAAVEVAVYVGVDQDGDPLDDFSGSEPFDIDPASLDMNGDPVALFDMGSITAGTLVAGPSTLDIGLGAPLNGVLLEGTVGANAATFASVPLDAAVPEAVLAQIPAPFPFTGTIVDVLGGLFIFPDVDLTMDGVNDAYSVEFTLTAVSCIIVPPPVMGIPYLRGDSNGDGQVNLADAISILGELFSGGTPGPCEAAGDVNDDGTKNVADPISLLGFLFSGEAAPTAPFPLCGLDPTPDMLPCSSNPLCP